jgi:hypothetical protein
MTSSSLVAGTPRRRLVLRRPIQQRVDRSVKKFIPSSKQSRKFTAIFSDFSSFDLWSWSWRWCLGVETCEARAREKELRYSRERGEQERQSVARVCPPRL